MIEFEISGETYRVNKLDAFAQLHISRKLSPVLPKLLPALFKIFQSGQAGAFATLANPVSVGLPQTESGGGPDLKRVDIELVGDIASTLDPVAEVLASMPDADAEYVYSACLGAVSRRQGSAWAPIWSRQQAVCMFDDIDLGVMTLLVARVVMDSLGGFIRGLLAKTGERPKTPGSSGNA
ncbi:phage tail assembly chaperone [Paraburkholderia dioscoreae]|jgi:hypothetical protein|uniref:Bacteriophage protein n=1 Tax=Paraburkholderia dioscoreae TaxID=2604047 RepID=A0A5Q4YVP7_9BURK|nr:hypothetical protein [Paraburkholderia dioscoreae]VVD29158.1 conserved protein of unknown function [Paraburkholderia dioscoreae]